MNALCTFVLEILHTLKALLALYLGDPLGRIDRVDTVDW